MTACSVVVPEKINNFSQKCKQDRSTKSKVITQQYRQITPYDNMTATFFYHSYRNCIQVTRFFLAMKRQLSC